jgi:hypothetical protein
MSQTGYVSPGLWAPADGSLLCYEMETFMKTDRFVKLLLLVIAVATSAIAIRPYLAPPAVKAQDGTSAYPFYIEPGTYMLRAPDASRQVLGRVVIDMRNGNVWGFPTTTSDPYPSSPASSAPVTSHPFLLGTFAWSDVDKANQPTTSR